ncbi:MAG: 2-phosphosulfolactate phosphatase [Candidatus Hydrogenedentes bacterium]|nr:2-phosphosulfolactate phosphatase [Candidatus Hydrogenedentota bacterium]
MVWHFIAGEEGCSFAVRHGCVAIVVDAMRASATAAYMLHAGAAEILAVREIEEARALKARYPDAVLAGERGGVPPEGFALGNSPREVSMVQGMRVVFTTTTGAGRLVECWGAHAIYMGSPVNASAVARAAFTHGRDVVMIPAGLMSDASFNAQEDWVGAVVVAMAAEHLFGPLTLGEGGHRYTYWNDRILCDGVEKLFQTAPHAEKLREVGLADDIAFCARIDTVTTIPVVVGREDGAVRMVGRV